MRLLKYSAIFLTMCFPASLFAAATSTYECGDGEQVVMAFPDENNAVMYYQGQLVLLKNVPAADGARYVGEGWQWWGKGTDEGSLSVIVEGESIASNLGKSCKIIKASASIEDEKK